MGLAAGHVPRLAKSLASNCCPPAANRSNVNATRSIASAAALADAACRQGYRSLSYRAPRLISEQHCHAPDSSRRCAPTPLKSAGLGLD
jgi:hypothetical protein